MSLTPPDNLHQPRLGFFSRLLDEVPAAERYRLVTEQIAHAEAQGFDSAWIAQHHFHESEGGLPSPFVFLSHVAARTRRIRLGTGVVTLPLENALRVAEDAAVLDLLSDGRLEVGLGTGGTAESFEAFGVTGSERGAEKRSGDRSGHHELAEIGDPQARQRGLPVPRDHAVSALPGHGADGRRSEAKGMVVPIAIGIVQQQGFDKVRRGISHTVHGMRRNRGGERRREARARDNGATDRPHM